MDFTGLWVQCSCGMSRGWIFQSRDITCERCTHKPVKSVSYHLLQQVHQNGTALWCVGLNTSSHQQASSSLTQLLADWQCECLYAVDSGHLVAVTSNAHQKVVWLHITMNEAFAVYKLNTTNHLQQRHRQIINSSTVTPQLSLSVQWHQFDISELTRHART